MDVAKNILSLIGNVTAIKANPKTDIEHPITKMHYKVTTTILWIRQGLLKIWTKHSVYLYLLK